MCGHIALLLCSMLECGQVKVVVPVVIHYCMNNESYMTMLSLYYLDVT
jgi:hypothetical protein